MEWRQHTQKYAIMVSLTLVLGVTGCLPQRSPSSIRQSEPPLGNINDDPQSKKVDSDASTSFAFHSQSADLSQVNYEVQGKNVDSGTSASSALHSQFADNKQQGETRSSEGNEPAYQRVLTTDEGEDHSIAISAYAVATREEQEDSKKKKVVQGGKSTADVAQDQPIIGRPSPLHPVPHDVWSEPAFAEHSAVPPVTFPPPPCQKRRNPKQAFFRKRRSLWEHRAKRRGKPLPKELNKARLPDYVIEPPDILLIDAVRVVPRPPYRIAPLDSLILQVEGAFPKEPIAGPYPVEPDGTINLGLSYGSVSVVGMTLDEAREAIRKQLATIVKEPRVAVYLGQTRGSQQIRGEHLVRPDGKVSLGTYGTVPVAGLTVQQAKRAIEHHLGRYLLNPEVTIDVGAYNSKVFYIIFDGGGAGQEIVRLPVTGSDTVLDAMSQVGGLSGASSQYRIWVARAAPEGVCDQILPVDWVAITKRGRTETNYQLTAGDRIYVKAQPLLAFDYYFGVLIAPIERLTGFSLLFNGLVNAFRTGGTGFGGGGGF